MAVLQDININVHGQPSEKRLQTFLRLSQNENGRMISFRVLGPPLPSNCTATFSGTKPDGNVYSKTGTVTGNFVIIEEDIQMTAVAGVWDAKLDIINGTHNIMTALIRVVVDADVVDPDAIASDSQLQGLVAEAKYYAEHARTDAYGSPLTATTAAEMTDKTRVYVYTGSETGMTAGNWYYWNGSAWTSGGVYNAVAVQTDTTLSVAGKAADGKATGDAIDALKEDLTSLDGRVEALEQGGGSSHYLPADFIEALQAILSEAIYGTDQSDAIDDLSDFSDNTHYYDVTLTMTHCTSSNASTKALGGESYTTTITASEGYTLTSVTCTMGGTAQTVTNGVISIAEVTGDIVITATAEIHEEGLLYKLSETTTFDGTNTIDTGIALEGNYNSDNTIEFTIACTTTCTDTGDKYPFSVYSTAQSGAGLYVDLSGKSNVYGKWFTQSKNTSLSWVSADVLRIVFRKKSGEYPTVSFTKNGDTTNTKTLTFTSMANNAVIASADHVIIGCSPSGAGKLKGTMSDFRVYDRAYSDAELTSYLGGE